MTSSQRSDPLEMEPVVILAILTFGAAATPSATVLESLSSRRKHVIAVSASEAESSCYRQAWKDNFTVPLLILRERDSDRIDVALSAVEEIVRREPERSIAVLIADGPEVAGFRADHRDSNCTRFADGVHRLTSDAQVFLYSSSWLVRPPRIR